MHILKINLSYETCKYLKKILVIMLECSSY